MTITYSQFASQLLGARSIDEHRWTRLSQEDCLWSIFAFADDGAHYIGARNEPSQPNIFEQWGMQ